MKLDVKRLGNLWFPRKRKLAAWDWFENEEGD
jgi:hypothetical protein